MFGGVFSCFCGTKVEQRKAAYTTDSNQSSPSTHNVYYSANAAVKTALGPPAVTTEHKHAERNSSSISSAAVPSTWSTVNLLNKQSSQEDAPQGLPSIAKQGTPPHAASRSPTPPPQPPGVPPSASSPVPPPSPPGRKVERPKGLLKSSLTAENLGGQLGHDLKHSSTTVADRSNAGTPGTLSEAQVKAEVQLLSGSSSSPQSSVPKRPMVGGIDGPPPGLERASMYSARSSVGGIPRHPHSRLLDDCDQNSMISLSMNSTAPSQYGNSQTGLPRLLNAQSRALWGSQPDVRPDGPAASPRASYLSARSPMAGDMTGPLKSSAADVRRKSFLGSACSSTAGPGGNSGDVTSGSPPVQLPPISPQAGAHRQQRFRDPETASESAVQARAAQQQSSSQVPDASEPTETPPQLLSVLGKGSYGTVYKARWRNMDVAVKTTVVDFSKMSLDDANWVKNNAIREGEIVAQLSHPNVVTTYLCKVKIDARPSRRASNANVADATESTTDPPTSPKEAPWQLNLVQELCDGDLTQVLSPRLLHDKQTKQPHFHGILQLVRDLAMGMQYIHRHDIIHGDLNPRNILIKIKPSALPLGCVAKIADFGLAVRLPPGQNFIRGVKHGTPFYVAPEVAEKHVICKQSDVYSFGVLLWELYRGKPPFVCTKVMADGKWTGKYHYSWREGFPELPATTPPLYCNMVQACLDHNPSNRPAFNDVLLSLAEMFEQFNISKGRV